MVRPDWAARECGPRGYLFASSNPGGFLRRETPSLPIPAQWPPLRRCNASLLLADVRLPFVSNAWPGRPAQHSNQRAPYLFRDVFFAPWNPFGILSPSVRESKRVRKKLARVPPCSLRISRRGENHFIALRGGHRILISPACTRAMLASPCFPPNSTMSRTRKRATPGQCLHVGGRILPRTVWLLRFGRARVPRQVASRRPDVAAHFPRPLHGPGSGPPVAINHIV